jgi:lipoprotein-anchoring transpeptidase ErfK/SrfK
MGRRRSYAVGGAVALAVSLSGALAGTAAARATYKQGREVAWVRGPAAMLHAGATTSPPISIGGLTPFGSPTTFSVVSARPGWARVISSALPNASLGWIPFAQIRITFDPFALEVDLSRQTLVVWRAGTLLRQISVAIGSPTSPTPIGQFAVTDKLRDFYPDAYGCCVLAISGRQTRLPLGWTGGDRLAIHVGDGIGAAVSNGCLHASETDLRWLLDRIPLGTRIVIHP